MKQWFIKHFVYPLHGTFSGRPILKCSNELEKSQWWSGGELVDLQWRKLQSILIHAQTYVPYYRDSFTAAGIDALKIKSPSDLAGIPLLTKSKIRKNILKIVADGIRISSLKMGGSSGSSGENVTFYHDTNCRAHFLGAIIRNHRWCGADIGDREVRIWGSAFDLSSAANATGKLKSYFQNVRFISSYEMKSENMLRHINNLRKWKPVIITAYPTAADVFARYLLERDIKDIRPKGIISSAEMLLPQQRDRIEKAFGCKVFNRYGSREVGDIAQECDCGGFHINMERVYVEIATNDNVSEDVQSGEVLVTDLDNYGFPLIRYRIGDMARLSHSSKACKCGRKLQMLEDIEGRSMDVIRTVSGRALPGTFWTILLRPILGIVQFQIIQKKLEHIVFNMITDCTFPNNAVSKIKEMVWDYCGKETQVEINLVDKIDIGRSGKFRFIISEI